MDSILCTFDFFMAYSPGYFVVDIVAQDLVGHNNTAIISIYILMDDQRIKIIINEIPTFHVDKKGQVNFVQTELLIHVVNRDIDHIPDMDQ
ncbi:Cadherin-23 [Saguinus oedipus]|uniref:Cadherin-23 n=1 Tax=Saguinus oedipus TaxID=9490 RepID=A0ABQ9U8B7_SAGOE|nr:Cadherin-23 [Saguinus oedipus]